MAIIRVEKTKDYTVMSNYHLQDERLSYKAMGLLSQVLSLPEVWDYSIEGLATLAGGGKKAVRSCIKELEDAGYLTRKRTQGEHGKFAYEYTFYERPLTLSPCTLVGHTQAGYTPVEPQESTNEESTKKKVSSSRAKPPTIEEVIAYIKEKGYKVDPYKFYDYYEAGDWKTKAGKYMAGNWKQYVVSWNNKELERIKDQPKGYNSDYEREPDQKKERSYSQDEFERLLGISEE